MYGRLFILLLLGALFCAPAQVVADTEPGGIRVVVLDAGHGGIDAGTCHYGVREKDLTLKIVLRLGALIEKEMPGVKVVYTRKTDKALADQKANDLQARANIANRADGDIFISVHVNAVDLKPGRTSPEGTLTLVMGEKPKEQAYNETALYENNKDELIDMSDERTAAIVRAYIQNLQFTYGEYSLTLARCIESNYKAIGRHSLGVRPQMLRVLYATNMPCVLTEIGFLTHSKEAAFLKSEQGQEKIAQALLKSVKEYSAHLARMRGDTSETTPQATEQPADTTESAAPTASIESATPSDTAAEGSDHAQESASVTEPAPKEQPQEEQPTTQKPDKQQPEQSASEQKQEIRYTIQILASPKVVPAQSSEFKSFRGKAKQYIASDSRFKYKYGVGSYATQDEAKARLREVRKTFPDAFVIRVEGGKVVK